MTLPFESVASMQEAARKLQKAGYTVLVATGCCGHWVGYSAFRGDESYVLTFLGAPSLGEPVGHL